METLFKRAITQAQTLSDAMRAMPRGQLRHVPSPRVLTLQNKLKQTLEKLPDTMQKNVYACLFGVHEPCPDNLSQRLNAIVASPDLLSCLEKLWMNQRNTR